MTSKKGEPVLVSLLQYMKHTTLENSEILVKDERIAQLDEIVTEIKQSEEWEAVKMNILEIGIEKGIEQGLQQGLQQGVQQGAEKKLLEQVEKKLKKGQTIAQIADALEESEAKIREVVDLLQKD